MILGSITACYERQEGCLDSLSTNFEIATDDACDDCCTYPAITFEISHFLGDLKYNSDSIEINDFGQQFKMNQSLIYLSDFQFKTSTAKVLEVGEQSLYEQADGSSFSLKEDHVLIDQNDAILSIGTVRDTGLIQSISCDLGIHHNYISLDDGEVLFESDSLYTENQYFDAVFYLKVGPLLEDDIILRIRNVSENKIIDQSVIEVDKIARSSVITPLVIDYLALLKTIDLEGITDSKTLEEFIFPDDFIKFN